MFGVDRKTSQNSQFSGGTVLWLERLAALISNNTVLRMSVRVCLSQLLQLRQILGEVRFKIQNGSIGLKCMYVNVEGKTSFVKTKILLLYYCNVKPLSTSSCMSFMPDVSCPMSHYGPTAH